SAVEVSGGSYSYRYTVNGQAQEMRGIGYNLPTVSEDAVGRAARLERDFALMQAAGVNTILGWDQAGYDELLLDIAQRHNIGVVLPFDLPETADYANPEVRATLKAQALAWVGRYKYHPALRLWGLGNEVMHKEKSTASKRLRDFSSFLIAT